MSDCFCNLYPYDNCLKCDYFRTVQKWRSSIAVKLHRVSHLTKLLRESQIGNHDTTESYFIRMEIINQSNKISRLQFAVNFLRRVGLEC